MREAGSTLAAGRWLLWARLRGVGSFGGRGLLALVRRLAFGAQNKSTATQQGAAPDRLQPALWSFLPSLRLSAAGDLGRCGAAPYVVAQYQSTLVADTRRRELKLAASALLRLQLFGSGAAFWVSATDMFRLASKYFGRAATAIPASQLRHNKSLHPTACSPLVPRSLPAAGEFKRCAAASTR